MHYTSIESVASAFPGTAYTQREVGRLLGVENPVVWRLLDAPHIQTRYLMLDAEPGCDVPAVMPKPTLTQLDKRFKTGVLTFGLQAVRDAMTNAGVTPEAIGAIVAVTSSGLALPGVTAMLMRELGINRKAHRADIVGMGCNAGMSGLRTLSQMLAARPVGTVGLLLCCEVNSALYVADDTVGTGIVNSLFGDGAVAVVVRSGHAAVTEAKSTPTAVLDNKSFPSCHPIINANISSSTTNAPRLRLVDFESATFTELFDDMRYDVDEDSQLYNFKLSKRIPEAVATALVEPVTELLDRANLKPSDVQHWVVHSGGAAVIQGVISNLGLQPDALRHTTSVLRDCGNISSGSLLVSYERLLAEHAEGKPVIRPGDRAVMIGMGPGATIEVGLGYFA
jgi:polyketide synthase Type III